jgi:hypothetical protein
MVPLQHLGSRDLPRLDPSFPPRQATSAITQYEIRNTKNEERTPQQQQKCTASLHSDIFSLFVFSFNGHFLEFTNPFLHQSSHYPLHSTIATIIGALSRSDRKPSPIMASDNSYDWKYYRYDPSLVAAVIFMVLFVLITSFQLYQLVRTRTWYFIPLVVGGFCTCTREVPKYMC